MEKIKTLFAHRIFKILKWAFFVLLLLYLILVVVRVFHFFNLDKTNAAVAKIHATKLTLDDALGANLPPDPGEKADDTIAGFDVNQNGIRDDLELAIFAEYPNSAKTRAVLLQYALVLQMQMTLPIINKETVTATVEDNESRAQICLWNLSSRSNMEKFITDIERYETYVKQLQINNEQRKDYLRRIFENNLDSFSASNESCDIDLYTLLN